MSRGDPTSDVDSDIDGQHGCSLHLRAISLLLLISDDSAVSKSPRSELLWISDILQSCWVCVGYLCSFRLFLAVSKPISTTKGSNRNIYRDLQVLHVSAPSKANDIIFFFGATL